MSDRVQMPAWFAAWLVAAVVAAQGERAHALNVDREGGICIRKELPPHLWPHHYESPAPVAGPLHEPHHPHGHGDDQLPAPGRPAFVQSFPQQPAEATFSFVRGPETVMCGDPAAFAARSFVAHPRPMAPNRT